MCVIVVVSRQQIECDCCAMLLVHHPEARGAPQAARYEIFPRHESQEATVKEVANADVLQEKHMSKRHGPVQADIPAQVGVHMYDI